MQEYLVLPGYGGSGPLHWQTLWEARDPAFRRVAQQDWEHVVSRDWAQTLEAALSAARGDVILVAHSLACLLVDQWADMAAPASLAKVKAALLVAPPDPSGPEFPAHAVGFSPLHLSPFPFRSLVVASTNDPYATVEFCLQCSMGWGSRFEVIGPKGHINSSSGLGEWDDGFRLLSGLVRG